MTARLASALRAWLAAAVVAGCGAAPTPGPSVRQAPAAEGQRWVATWTASQERVEPPLRVVAQTLRQIARVSLGGARVRVHLSNAFGGSALHVGAAHVALRASGASIVPGSDRPLTFGGSPYVRIPAGASVLSDPVTLTVPSLAELAVSLYLPDPVSLETQHPLASQTTYVSVIGDFTGEGAFASLGSTTSWYVLSGIDVEGPAASAAIVALGDSITDGDGSTLDAHHRWPDVLAERLAASHDGPPRAILDAGISGNRVLHEFIGPSTLARLDGDALVQAGARYLIVLEGINDIGLPAFLAAPDQSVTADEIIGGHRQILERAHALGFKVLGGTLMPYEDNTLPRYYSPEGEQKRQAINRWIRTSGAYDAVIDFDQATRDPAHPSRLAPAFDSGDHLHPNDAGYRAMAGAIDLSLFR